MWPPLRPYYSMSLGVKKIIRIEELALKLNEEEDILKIKISEILGLPVAEIINYIIIKKNIDSRHPKNILFIYSLDVEVRDTKLIKNWSGPHRVRLQAPYIYQEKIITKKINKKIMVVGSGPCGLFTALLLAKAGLRPVLIERGKDLDSRIKDVDKFIKQRKLNPESNLQFGEGGAGTFSDGKLYTLINDPRSKYLFSELVKFGAPKEILTSGAPHIGTDKLREVIKNIRQEIIKLGGEIRFKTCLTGLELKGKKIKAVILNNQEKFLVDDLVLATGHSARDTYRMLYEQKINMSAKAFSVGLRIEHRAEMINKARYGAFYNHQKLGPARYKLVEHLKNNRSVYTFCMCPGGYVMAAASEKGGVVVNGMSKYAQDGVNSNSALLVPVTPTDFSSDHPLAGIEFQRQWERAAYLAGGSDYSAPGQLVGDFLERKASTKIKNVIPSYQPGVKLTSLDSCLPKYVVESIREALPLMDKKLKGFASPEAILTGVETRSSSPVRLERDEKCESNILGVYPAGEGAGQAGGIVSSALDGLRVAEIIIEKYL